MSAAVFAFRLVIEPKANGVLQREVRADEVDVLFFHPAELVVAQFEAMFDRVSAAFDHVVGGFAAKDMHGHLQAGIVSFVYGCTDVVGRINVGVIVGDQFDDTGPVVDVLVDSLADLRFKLSASRYSFLQSSPASGANP